MSEFSRTARGVRSSDDRRPRHLRLDLTKVVDVRVGAVRDARRPRNRAHRASASSTTRRGGTAYGLPGVDVLRDDLARRSTRLRPGIARAGHRRGTASRRHERAGVSAAHAIRRVVIVLEAMLRRGYLYAKVMARAPNGNSHRAAFRLDRKARLAPSPPSPTMPPEPLAIQRRPAGAPHERDTLNARIAKYLDERRSHGYYEARGEPTWTNRWPTSVSTTFTVDPGAPRPRRLFRRSISDRDLTRWNEARSTGLAGRLDRENRGCAEGAGLQGRDGAASADGIGRRSRHRLPHHPRPAISYCQRLNLWQHRGSGVGVAALAAAARGPAVFAGRGRRRSGVH